MKKSVFGVAIATVAMMVLAGCSSGTQTTGTQTAGTQTAGTQTARNQTTGTQTTGRQSPGIQAPAAASPGIATVASLTTAAPTFQVQGRLITAEGTGTVTGTPDVVTVGLGVQTSAPTASAALADNNQRAATVIAVLKKNGVADADLQTNELSINPSYTNGGQINGYQVSNTVTARLRKVSTAGALIDAVGRAAGNAIRVQELSFSIDNDSALRANAREDAVKQAQAQAQQMAQAAGVKLGEVYSITESPSQNQVTNQTYAAAADAPSAAVPVEAGTEQMTVNVEVVYEIA